MLQVILRWAQIFIITYSPVKAATIIIRIIPSPNPAWCRAYGIPIQKKYTIL